MALSGRIGWRLRGVGVAVGVALLISGQPARAEWDLRGSVKQFSLVSQNTEFRGATRSTSGFAQSALRLSVAWEMPRYGGEVAYGLYPQMGANSSSLSGAASRNWVVPLGSGLRKWDFDQAAVEGDGLQVLQNLDRLNVYARGTEWQLRVGRQAIGHGSARLFSPTDILAPFAFASLDTEYKLGVDAVRLSYTLGERTEVELLGVATSDLKEGAYLLRLRTGLSGIDFSGFGGVSYQEPTLGLDVATDLFGAAAYAEMLYRYRDGASNPHIARTTLGLHYQLEMGVGLIAEAFFNSGGASAADGYIRSALSSDVQRAELFFVGKWYTGAAATYSLSGVVSTQVSVLTNWGDPSSFFNWSFGWSVEQNTNLNFGLMVPFGAPPVLASGLIPIELQSEFGVYPTLFFMEVQLYL